MKYFPRQPYILLYDEEIDNKRNKNADIKRLNVASIADCEEALKNLIVGRALHCREEVTPETIKAGKHPAHYSVVYRRITLFSHDCFRSLVGGCMGTILEFFTLEEAAKLVSQSSECSEYEREDY